jgi:hypothetical protein
MRCSSSRFMDCGGGSTAPDEPVEVALPPVARLGTNGISFMRGGGGGIDANSISAESSEPDDFGW